MTTLASLVLSFTAETSIVLPRDLGRASHAIFLQCISQHSPALAAHLHESSQTKPFTCSNVHGGRRRGSSVYYGAGETGWLRFTGLNAEVCNALAVIASAPPARIDLDGNPVPVTLATLDPAAHPYAAGTTYEALGAPYLLAKEMPASRITLRFFSPSAFRAKDQNLPLPLPRSVFGSLLEKWNAFAPITLPDEARRFAEECMAISRFRLRSRAWAAKQSRAQIGFVGMVMFAALNRDRYWMGLMNVLADYAFFAGVGYQTTQGMGQCRRIAEMPAERADGAGA
jgi:CRISPR-associated endoribonuclease Cas6